MGIPLESANEGLAQIYHKDHLEKNDLGEIQRPANEINYQSLKIKCQLLWNFGKETTGYPII